MDDRPANYRKYIDLLSSRPGLPEPMLALTSRESSVIDDLRESFEEADPAKIDARLRAIIRTAQRARKALAEGED